MSQSTFDRLSKELESYIKADRPRLLGEIEEARLQGNLDDNARYQSARDLLAQTEGKIGILQDKLARSEIIKVPVSESDHIIFGANVTVKDLSNGSTKSYTLVGPEGVDITQGKISSHSPIGKSLIGKKIGDIVKIDTPKGSIKLEITDFN